MSVRRYIDHFAWGPDIADLASPDGGVRWAAGGVGCLIGFTTSGVSSSVDGTYFPTYDGNGNVMGMLQKNGAGKTEVAAVYDYSPFGRLIRSTGKIADINPIRFSTKIHNQDAGLVYYGYRHYDPEAGRWLSRDPIGEEGGVNLYAMVGNDPVNSWDYLGLLDGHHMVVRQIWDSFPRDAPAARVFDEAASRIQSSAYNVHSNGTRGGITHPQYNKLLKAEFEKFLKAEQVTSGVDLDEAKARKFVGKIRNSMGDIGRFNRGVKAEVAFANNIVKNKLSVARVKQLIKVAESKGAYGKALNRLVDKTYGPDFLQKVRGSGAGRVRPNLGKGFGKALGVAGVVIGGAARVFGLLTPTDVSAQYPSEQLTDRYDYLGKVSQCGHFYIKVTSVDTAYWGSSEINPSFVSEGHSTVGDDTEFIFIEMIDESDPPFPGVAPQ